jgi:uncharacterized membrane protein YfcA
MTGNETIDWIDGRMDASLMTKGGAMVFALVLGVLAGLITTVAGMGGGLVLMLGLATIFDPMVALAATGPGLLVGNMHRVWMYRRRVVRSTARRYVVGAVPGAIVGGLLASVAPEDVVRISMLVMASLATAKTVLGLRWDAPSDVMIPGGVAIGFISATSGGGGLLAGPLLLATGLTGRSYVATASVGAVAIHVSRLAGYGAGGVLTKDVLQLGAVLAGCILVGNVLGDRIRRILPPTWGAKLEVGVVFGGLILAVVGMR